MLFSFPFVALALYTNRVGFLSDSHALVLAKALLAADRGRLEVIGFVYPPLPFLLATVWPSAWTVSLLSGITAGATAWLLWYDLRRTELPLVVQTLLLASVVLVPNVLFLATQSLPEMLALHLVLVAWHYFLNFVRLGHTWSGFTAGLVLGLAFFASFYAIVFALAFAVSSPIYSHLRADGEDRSPQADVARMMVIVFPALWSLASWSYLNWVFTGDPLRFLTDPVTPVLIPAAGTGSVVGAVVWSARQSLRELLLQPLFFAVAGLNVQRRRRLIIAFVSMPLILVTIRAAGFAYGELLALGTYSLVALAGIPRRVSRLGSIVLVVVALLQVVTSSTLTTRHPWLADWRNAVTLGQITVEARSERALAARLAQAPPRSILADDRVAYRVIARAGTARPFLLPTDAAFTSALDRPREQVAYLLVASRAVHPADEVSRRFAERPPDGFLLDGALAGYALFRRVDAPALLGQP